MIYSIIKIINLINLGQGKCGVAVIRVSGEKTKLVLKRLTGTDIFKERHATLKRIRNPMNNEAIDTGIVMYFKGPKSFTGEDSAEFQVHGSTAVVSAILDALSSIEGVRLSRPGEFTKRSFLNGKMDLTECEAVADLINSETEFQRKQALIQADGHLSKLFNTWRKRLIKNVAHIEAYIDFSEDENIEDDVLHNVIKDLRELETEIRNHLNDGRKGEKLRDGVRLVLCGKVNAGKSSLMNHLVQKDISIVTEVSGTTRDIIKTSIDINGNLEILFCIPPIFTDNFFVSLSLLSFVALRLSCDSQRHGRHS
jgi:tRNA modification GTPase TrmE